MLEARGWRLEAGGIPTEDTEVAEDTEERMWL
jgi:hypothetical protein